VVAALEAVLQRLRPRQPQHTERLGTPAGDQGVVPGSAEFVNESDVGNDPLDAVSPHRIADQTGVAHVPGDHGQSARQAREDGLRHSGQRSVAQDHHAVAAGEQRFDQIEADEAGPTGHQDRHCVPPSDALW
jgi:hypothetical protein